MKSLAILIGFFLVMTGIHYTYSETIPISKWIKDTARLWSEQKIDDSRFIQSIQYLIKSKVIQAPSLESSEHVYFLPKYGQTSFVTISGITGDLKKTNNVFLTIIRPDGKTIESKAAVLETGVYRTTLILYHDFPIGMYKVTGTYNDYAIPISYFYVKESMTKIPLWFKNNAGWWADGKVSDSDFVLGLQYLINKKILHMEYDSETVDSQTLHVDVEGKSQVRRGTMQDVIITVTDGQEPITDVIVLVQVEDYGENIFEHFNGNTDSNGKYVISWEIDKNAEAETLLVFVDVTDGFSSTSSVFSFEVTCHCGEQDCECR
ncbi:MAG TPA: hypothetical protein VLA53_05960 [Nitrosopumilaceae archaeon]|nr:hypothetical protein [Nitrosopumilaceae archaeon]